VTPPKAPIRRLWKSTIRPTPHLQLGHLGRDHRPHRQAEEDDLRALERDPILPMHARRLTAWAGAARGCGRGYRRAGAGRPARWLSRRPEFQMLAIKCHQPKMDAMNITSLTFDRSALSAWLANLSGDAANGFIEAVHDGFFEKHISSNFVADICLDGDARKPFLPFAKKTLISHEKCVVSGLDRESVDVVVMPAVLEHLANPFKVIRAAMEALRPGGNLIVSVPSRDLYERKLEVPSRWSPGHQRFYTVSSLFLEVQAACGINSFRVRYAREFDRGHSYDSPHEKHARGSYATVVVFEKTGHRDWYTDIPRLDVAKTGQLTMQSAVEQAASVDLTAVLNPQLDPAAVRRICVLKVDHIGDFVMAIPVFEEIRVLFPNAHITCVCGNWNADLAKSIELFDEIVICDYYKRDEKLGGSAPKQKMLAAQSLGDTFAKEVFDIAMDLRVPDDSRELIAAVPARYRAAVGDASKWPFLDVALPNHEAFNRGLTTSAEAQTFFWNACLFSVNDGHAVPGHRDILIIKRPIRGHHFLYGPYRRLERGAYRVKFFLSALSKLNKPVRIGCDVAAQQQSIVSYETEINNETTEIAFDFNMYSTLESAELRLELLDNDSPESLVFSGVELECLTGRPTYRHMPPGQLHMKEQMALLLALVRTRLFGSVSARTADRLRSKTSEPAAAGGTFFVLAPFSNSELRDWPLGSFTELTKLLLRHSKASICLMGANDHAESLEKIRDEAAGGDASDRIVTCAGAPWATVFDLISRSAAVIANNSGIAHVSALLGAHTIAIYSASHQPIEWGPIGANVKVLHASLFCGRCGFDTLRECRSGLACMQIISPQFVFSELKAISPNLFPAAATAAEPAKEVKSTALKSISRA
jgi:ADP-heptose:LPS heptosyltransferase/SAM-dependent methyltransferase